MKDSHTKVTAPLDSREKSANLKAEPVNKKNDSAVIQLSQASSERSLEHKPQPHHMSLVKTHYRQHPAANPKENVQQNNSLLEKRSENKPSEDQKKREITAQNVGPQKIGSIGNKVSIQEEHSQSQIAPTNKNTVASEKVKRVSNAEENKVQRGRNEEERKHEAYLDEEGDFDFQNPEKMAEDDHDDSQNLKIEQEPISRYNPQEQRERASKNKNEGQRQINYVQIGKSGPEQGEENFEEHSVAQIQKIPTVDYEQVSHNPLRLESNVISEEYKEKVVPHSNAFAVHHGGNQGYSKDIAYSNAGSKPFEGYKLKQGQNDMINEGEAPTQLNFERGLEEIRRTVYSNAEKASHVLKIDESVRQKSLYFV